METKSNHDIRESPTFDDTPDCIFIVTVCKYEGSSWPHPVSLHLTFKEAEEVILKNEKEIQKDHFSKEEEDFYDCVAIEKIGMGYLNKVKSRWIYEWQTKERKFVCTEVDEECDSEESICGLF